MGFAKSVLVIPKYDINEQDNEGHDYFVLDAYIVVIDNATGKIICKFIEPNAWTSDALMLTGISIDTGLYHLNTTTRAFGIRVDYTGSSRPNPFSETHLSLYVADKNSLKAEHYSKKVFFHLDCIMRLDFILSANSFFGFFAKQIKTK